jgi:excisionase family DNA binding protein
MGEEFMKLKEAQEYLGVSRMKMWRLVKTGLLTVYENPLDRRERLVKREEVGELKQPRLMNNQ